jgi:hypothetical protein
LFLFKKYYFFFKKNWCCWPLSSLIDSLKLFRGQLILQS